MIEKPCIICKIIKPLDQFNLQPKRKDGHKSICIVCQSIMDKERYLAKKQGRKSGFSLSVYGQMTKDIISGQKKPLRILSLGGGVQSSTLSLMITRGEVPAIDAAIFADTGAEPQNVYDWLNYLIPKLSFPIYIVKNKHNTLLDEVNNIDKTKRWCGIPMFTPGKDNKGTGQLKRQCTSEYKIKPIQNKIREILEIRERGRVPSEILVNQLIGISADEIMRMKDNPLKYIKNTYPLVDLGMTRQDCLNWMLKNGYERPPKSACIFCPYHSDSVWYELKIKYAAEFQRAIEIDEKLRNNVRASKNNVFLHPSLKPLKEVVFKAESREINNFNNECEGMCGV